jgi:hypothetical protein
MGTSDFIPNSLKPCVPIESEFDLYAYESEIFGNFQGTVQYNMQSSAPTVSDVCAELTSSENSTPLEALASTVEKFYGSSSDSCVPSSWDDLMAGLLEVEFDGQSAMRQWIWQSCNEVRLRKTDA